MSATSPCRHLGSARVEARVTSHVGFKISGVLVDLHADVGDRLSKGAVLARLDDREQTSQVVSAKAGGRASRGKSENGNREWGKRLKRIMPMQRI